jgi:hypothetical protein
MNSFPNFGIALGIIGLLASSAAAKVTECHLESTEKELAPVLRIYEDGGFIHSATLEFTTDYGDTLPYLFLCEVNCVMNFEDDEFTYLLGGKPRLETPDFVTFVTKSKADDFKSSTEFKVSECNVQT